MMIMNLADAMVVVNEQVSEITRLRGEKAKLYERLSEVIGELSALKDRNDKLERVVEVAKDYVLAIDGDSTLADAISDLGGE